MNVLVLKPGPDPVFEAAMAVAEAHAPGAPVTVYLAKGDAYPLKRRNAQVIEFAVARDGGAVHPKLPQTYDLAVLPFDDQRGLRYTAFRRQALASGAPNIIGVYKNGASRQFGRREFLVDSLYQEALIRGLLAGLHAIDRPAFTALLALAVVVKHLRASIVHWRRAAPGPQRLGIVIPSMGLGGAQKQVMMLLENLPPEYEPYLFLLYPDDRFFEASARQHVRALEMLYPGDSYLFHTHLGAAFKLWQALRRHRIDTVHTYMLEANHLGAAAAHFAGARRVVTSVRTLAHPDYPWATPYNRRLDRLCHRAADTVIVNSRASQENLAAWAGLPPGKIHVVYNGSHVPAAGGGVTRADLAVAPDALVFGCFARLSWEKDHATLLRAFGIAAAAVPGAVLMLVGDGPDRAAITRQAAELGLEGRVLLLGHRADVPALLRLTDAVVQASVIEGLPNSLIEAALAGKPVVSTAAGGAAETVLHGQTGYLVPIGDASAFATAMVNLASDATLRERMGKAARDFANERFAAAAMVRETVRMYGD